MSSKSAIIIVAILTLVAVRLPLTVSAQPPVPCEVEYTVQAGDWLSKLAEKFYGDVLAFDQIVTATNAQTDDKFTTIENPDLIEPGWVLCIPAPDVVGLLLARFGPNIPPDLSPQALANATYQSQYTPAGSVTLENGRFSEPVAPGSATEIKVRLTPNVAYGELNVQPAAAVVLVSDPGGSGTFYDLHLMVSRDGRPANVATTFLGDRVQINTITVENNQIIVDLIQAGADDPFCCPSQQVLKSYELQGDQLVEVSNQIVQEGDGPDLTGTFWRWDQTSMNNGDKIVPDDPANYTAQFLPGGQVSIQADCNQVGGTYSVDSNSITIETGPTTLVACPPGSLGDQFVAQLSAASIYFIQGQNLFIDLKFDSGTMQFTAQSTELAGTSWIVTGYNNGRQAVVSVIVGTEMTATFGQDGNLSGSAGCNNYMATYQTNENNLTVGPAAATRKLCAEPEGIMEQEQLYLAALATAATYTIRGNKLELRSDDGALAATFARDQAAGATEIIQFDPASVQIDPGQEPLASTCQSSWVVPKAGVYRCLPEDGGALDPCFVLQGSTLLCSPNPVFGGYALAKATNSLSGGDPSSAEPVIFYLELEEGNPPCGKRADVSLELAGQPVTYACEAPGAWLVGDLDTAQPTWMAQRVITDPSATTVTDGPTPVEVRRAWVY